MKSKTLGILGLGSRSTLFYIEELNAHYNKVHQGFSTCPFKMLNTDFDKINNLLPSPSHELQKCIKSSIAELIDLGVDVILIPNITLFETIDNLQFESLLIHPVHATLSEILKSKHKKALVLGSKYTMESTYIQAIFADQDVETFPPTHEQILLVDNLRKHIYHKTETKEMLVEFNKLVHEYAKDFAVVIACTELSIALSTSDTNVFDMARIQIQNSIKQC